MEEAIRVCIRQRPLFQKEIDAGHVLAWKMQENGSLSLDITPPTGLPIKKAYTFDMCFDGNCPNEVVYEKTAKDIVIDTATGINGCYMAYGQTGCGKTHSIMGTANDPGILPRAVAELFDIIEGRTAQQEDEDVIEVNFMLRVSYVEIYLERVNDLLQDGPKGETQPVENLDVKEDPKEGFYVVGLAEKSVDSIQSVMQLLQRAEMKRHFARTNFNETSSRSHTVFSTILECTQTFTDGTTIVKKGELKLVDLAGNERASAAEGVESAKERQAEGQAINKSLFLLSEVIAKLSKKAEALKKGAGSAAAEKARKEMLHIPWRDSKLTRLLQKSLGGNSRAALLVAVHPSTQALEISLSTLRFALKTKQIKKKIAQNFVSPEQSLIMQQKAQIKALQQQLRALQEMTGVEVLPEIVGVPALGSPIPREKLKIIEKAQSNEAVEKLKAELQKKCDALSKIIMTTRFTRVKDGTSNERPDFTRSVTISGIEGRLERMQTLTPQRHEQLYKKLPVQVGEEKSKIKTIAGALEYLKNITEMNQESSPIEQQQKKEFGDVSTLSRYDTVKLEEVLAEEEVQFESMKKTREKMTALRQDNIRLISKNNAYVAQADYLQAIFTKLGLSVLIKGTEQTQKNAPPELSSTLKGITNTGKVFTLKSPEESLTHYLEKVQPMAFAMISRILCSAMDKLFSGKFNTDRKASDTSALKRRDEALRQLSLEKKVDSIITLLSPWEQHILALLFEQQQTRAALDTVTNQFKHDVDSLQKRLKALAVEKMELVDHCVRLVDELRHYRYEIVPNTHASTNENFARLLNQYERSSAEVAEKATESRLLRTDYAKLEAEKDALENQLQEMRRKFFSFDPSIIPDDLAHLDVDEDRKSLLREVMFSRHLVTECRLQLEESRAFEKDYQKVNQQLAYELKTTQASLAAVEKSKRLVDFELKNERVALQKRFRESYDAYEKAEERAKLIEARIGQLEADKLQLMNEFKAREEQLEGDKGGQNSRSESPRRKSISAMKPQMKSLQHPIGMRLGRPGAIGGALGRPKSALSRPTSAPLRAVRPGRRLGGSTGAASVAKSATAKPQSALMSSHSLKSKASRPPGQRAEVMKKMSASPTINEVSDSPYRINSNSTVVNNGEMEDHIKSEDVLRPKRLPRKASLSSSATLPKRASFGSLLGSPAPRSTIKIPARSQTSSLKSPGRSLKKQVTASSRR